MAISLGKKTGLLSLVREREISKKEAEEKKKQKQRQEICCVPDLPKDCVSNILIKLPLDSLHRSRFVCKPWYDIINSSLFIDTHLHRSELVLIFLRPLQEGKSKTFCIEDHLQPKSSFFQQSVFKHKQKYSMHFIEIKDGKSQIRGLNTCCLGKIRASCNGLVLLKNKLKRGGSLVINPVTRNFVVLPLGTVFPPQCESYGFAFSSCTGEYKVVHLFRDELGYVGCEILTLGMRSWRGVDGPSYGLFSWFGYDPVSAIGALHWVPHIDNSEYIVSMGVHDERFHKTPLPRSSRMHDGLITMGEFLCFLNHLDHSQIEIWMLKDLCEDWVKIHSITVGYIMDLVPLTGSRNFEVVIFWRDEDHSLYAYEIELQQMKKVGFEEDCFPSFGCYLPHVNSLVSWKIHKDQRQELVRMSSSYLLPRSSRSLAG